MDLKLLLGGKWVETGEWDEVLSPYDQSPVARVAHAVLMRHSMERPDLRDIAQCRHVDQGRLTAQDAARGHDRRATGQHRPPST